MESLAGKVAIVTGGTGGIGRGIACDMAAKGASVVVNGRDPRKGETVVAEIVERGGRARFIAGDVRDRAAMKRLVEGTAAAFGGADIVVPSAGGDDDAARSPQVRGPFAEIDLHRVAAFVGQALLAKLVVVQAAIPLLRAGGGGSVVFVTSEGGRVPTAGQTAIASFSAGLIQAAKLLSKELARERIRVNCVCVTVVRDSPSWEAVFGPGSTASAAHRRQYEAIVGRSPLGVAAPGDIARVVSFLASDDAHYLTGAALSPTGGLTLH